MVLGRLKTGMTVRVKLFLSFSVLVVLIIMLGTYSFFATEKMGKNTKEINDEWMRGVDLSHQINYSVNDFRRMQVAYLVVVDQGQLTEIENNMQTIIQKVEKDIASYINEATLEDVPIAKEVDSKWKEYLQYSQEFNALKQENRNDEAMVLLKGDLEELFNKLNGGTMKLVKFNQDNAAKAEDRSEGVCERTKVVLITIVIFALLFSALLAYLITRNINKSIAGILHVSQQVADGVLTEKVELKSQDEFGRLANYFNKMIDNLREVVAKIIDSSGQIAASSEELTASTEQSAQAPDQVASSIEDVAKDTEKQVTAVNEVSAVVQQISAGTQQLAASANNVTTMTDNAANATKRGAKAVERSVEQMNLISESTKNVHQEIENLTLGSKKINEISNVISGIADQTNLLALNAAIEAARAGDAGRGFAVVAEEVRKLAEQSQEATKQIAQLVDENHINIDNANKAIEKGADDVKVGIEIADTARTSFIEIERLASQVATQTQEVSAATQQIASGTQNAVSAVEEITKISKQTAVQAETVAAATEEQSATIEEIASSANTLSSMADELKSLVAKFKISNTI